MGLHQMTNDEDETEPKDGNVYLVLTQALSFVFLTGIGLVVLWGALYFVVMGYAIMTGKITP